MNEPFADSQWADNHERFSHDVGRLFDSMAVAMKVLNEKLYEAPWRRRELPIACTPPNHGA